MFIKPTSKNKRLVIKISLQKMSPSIICVHYICLFILNLKLSNKYFSFNSILFAKYKMLEYKTREIYNFREQIRLFFMLIKFLKIR